MDFDAEDFAEQLALSAKTLEAVISGGEVEIGGLFNDFETIGLANISNDVEQAILNITRLKGALNMDDGTNSITSQENQTGAGLMNISAENVELRTPNPTTQSTQVNTDASTSETMNQTILIPPQQPDKVTESVSSR